MKRLFLLLVGFIAVKVAISQTQAPEVQWQKSLGGSSADQAHSITQTSDGGYIVAGETGSNDGDVSGNHGYIDRSEDSRGW